MKNSDDVIAVGKLLDLCQTCPLNTAYDNYKTVCAGCDTYKKIRKLGKKLDDHVRSNYSDLHMTIDEYMKYKNEGLNDLDIAIEKDVSLATITRFKRENNLIKVRKAPMSLTIHDYFKMRNMKMTNKQIAEAIGTNKRYLYEWRKENGLVGSRSNSETA